jgi:hypothetical protein
LVPLQQNFSADAAGGRMPAFPGVAALCSLIVCVVLVHGKRLQTLLGSGTLEKENLRISWPWNPIDICKSKNKVYHKYPGGLVARPEDAVFKRR